MNKSPYYRIPLIVFYGHSTILLTICITLFYLLVVICQCTVKRTSWTYFCNHCSSNSLVKFMICLLIATNSKVAFSSWYRNANAFFSVKVIFNRIILYRNSHQKSPTSEGDFPQRGKWFRVTRNVLSNSKHNLPCANAHRF